MTPLGSNRDRHAPSGEGELGAKGLAVFLSDKRFDDLPCVLETGRDDGRVTAADVAWRSGCAAADKVTRKRASG